MSTIKLDIVTPERKVYSDEVEMVVARGVEGDLGILPKHMPLVTPLKISGVKIRKEGQEIWVAVSGGFMEVTPERVTILAQAAELPEEIDVARAEQAKARAEQRLAQSGREDIDYARAQRALQRAINRLEIAKYR